ncbi:MAG: 9-O-acetylesterase, partial [Kiritimatiellae bacterium]|nr:9-O-acetylesterase [Kiritimatiellia bacterium]
TDNAEQEIAGANFPMIRHFKAPNILMPVPQKDISAKWVVTSPETIPWQSAVAYYFGRRLHQALGVPVGLINSSWGGTRIEPWTPACGFEGLPELNGIKERVDSADPTAALHTKVLGDYIASLQKWIAEAQAKVAAKEPQTMSPAFPAQLVFPSHNIQEPTVLYNGMVSGLVPFAIRGAIWYQGCSNNGEGMLYLEKTKALVNGWRKVWGQGDFPYYLVQLAPYNYGAHRAKSLPGIWEAQAAVPAAIPNTGYTVINDIGNIKDIHPRNKQDVGLRMANQALNRTYGMQDIRWEGPVFKAYKVEGSVMRVELDHAEGLKTRDGKAPDWFELCGPDGIFRPARVKIEGSTIVLSAPDIAEPLAMRFAWDQLAEPNLINGNGLPAGAFRCGRAVPLDGVMSLPELKGFRKVYEIDLPLKGNFAAKAPVYNADESASAGDFSRVAYILQLQQGDNVSYVFAAMDAFTKDVKLLGIPYAGSGIKHQAKVANLTVRSNVDGIPLLDRSDGGNIEFWGLNYGHQNQLDLPGADNAKYDFDDMPASDGTYGCLQIHSWKDKVTLLAYNNFNGGADCDIGIGSNKGGGHPDHTFAANGAQHSVRRLSVFVK